MKRFGLLLLVAAVLALCFSGIAAAEADNWRLAPELAARFDRLESQMNDLDAAVKRIEKLIQPTVPVSAAPVRVETTGIYTAEPVFYQSKGGGLFKRKRGGGSCFGSSCGL